MHPTLSPTAREELINISGSASMYGAPADYSEASPNAELENGNDSISSHFFFYLFES